MRERVTLAFVACALVTGCQPDRPPFELGTFQIGDTSDSVKTKIPAVSCRSGERYDTLECSGKGSTFERAPILYTNVSIYRGHVERVGAIVDTSNADSILAAMKADYGPPDERPSTDLRERLGFTTWTHANGESLEFQRVDGPQSVIFLTGTTYIEAHKADPRLNLPKPDIKGVTLGLSMREVQRLLPDSTCHVEGDSATCIQRPVTFWGSHDASIKINLFNDSVKNLTVSGLEKSDFEPLMQALAKKFGPPNKDDPDKMPPRNRDTHVNWNMAYGQWIFATDPFYFDSTPTVELVDMNYLKAKVQAEKEAKTGTL